ncbi:CAAX farnesyltransferase (FTase) subunit beta [Dispira simplex]|nr:CAAX farnesyltransferase (FTase) subunit beta [Dispira simplex]
MTQKLTSYTTDDRYATPTSVLQREVEEDIGRQFEYHLRDEYSSTPLPIGFSTTSELRTLDNTTLKRDQHLTFLYQMIHGVDSNMQTLDSGKPWFSYWLLNSLDILSEPLTDTLKERVENTLVAMQNPDGGYGGPSQLSHLASTYAAVLALAIINSDRALGSINRSQLYQFLMRMKQPDGSFTAHVGGEVDVRGSYCAIVVAALTNLLTEELCENVDEFIVRCQTYEGGLGGGPEVEAHGGYTYCGLATLEILGKTHLLNWPALVRWSTARQMRYEGGFQGRTNKLVDGCYSFWVGGLFPLIASNICRGKSVRSGYLYDREKLQQYILTCCQGSRGGLRDKPEKHVDPYHTCYVLLGLSQSQHYSVNTRACPCFGEASPTVEGLSLESNPAFEALRTLGWTTDPSQRCFVGKSENLVRPTHPIFTILYPKVMNTLRYFYGDIVDHFTPV